MFLVVSDFFSDIDISHGSVTSVAKHLRCGRIFCYCFVIGIVMSCMRVCRKQALSRVKYYYY